MGDIPGAVNVNRSIFGVESAYPLPVVGNMPDEATVVESGHYAVVPIPVVDLLRSEVKYPHSHTLCRPIQAAAILDPSHVNLKIHPASLSGVGRSTNLRSAKCEYHSAKMSDSGLATVASASQL